MAYIPCILCAEKLDKRTDRNGKPYFVCNPCGIQLFVRRPHGIALLEKLIRNCEKNEIPYRQRAESIFKVQSVLTAINETKKQIERLKPQIGLLFRDQDKLRACNLLETKLENHFKELKELAK